MCPMTRPSGCGQTLNPNQEARAYHGASEGQNERRAADNELTVMQWVIVFVQWVVHGWSFSPNRPFCLVAISPESMSP
jgi:hypothetical protein